MKTLVTIQSETSSLGVFLRAQYSRLVTILKALPTASLRIDASNVCLTGGRHRGGATRPFFDSQSLGFLPSEAAHRRGRLLFFAAVPVIPLASTPGGDRFLSKTSSARALNRPRRARWTGGPGPRPDHREVA